MVGGLPSDPPSCVGIAADDERVVAGQLGRRPSPMSAVMARCPHGFPAAVEVLPADERGRPFPTLYYLTCPTAVATLSRLESAGGVELFQRVVDGDEGLRASLAQAAQETCERRAELAHTLGLTALDDGASLKTGIGGVADASRLKCLHAHAAHGLARPPYRLGAEIIAAAGGLWCDDRRCAAYTEDAP